LLDKANQRTATAYDDLPQQLHASRLPAASLTLGPGQAAIVPITFLPRFPARAVPLPTTLATPPSATVSLSAWQRADFDNCLGPLSLTGPRHRSNRPWQVPSSTSTTGTVESESAETFQVTTTLLVDTNRGIVKLPVSATSVRSNEYGLPDILYFDMAGQDHVREPSSTSGAPPSTASNNSNGSSAIRILDSDRAAPSQETEAPSSDDSSNKNTPNHQQQDCFDLFLKHPGKMLRHANGPPGDTTIELVVDTHTKIEVLEVLLSNTKHLNLQVLPEKAVGNHRRRALYPSSPSQVIRDWTDHGPLILPPDGKQHYVVTVCTAATANGEVVVEPDEAAELYLEKMAHLIDAGNDSHALGFLQIRTDSDTLFLGLERSMESESPTIRFPTVVDTPDEKVDSKDLVVPDVASVPESVNIHLLSSASPTATASIGISNLLKATPITLMRVSVAMQLDEPGLAEQMGLEVKIRLASHDVSIAPKATVTEALTLECSVDWERLTENLSRDSIKLVGSILVRATSDERTYLEWMEEQKMNPLADSNLVLEIPFSLNIVKGKIALKVQGTTHPFPLFWSMDSLNEDIDTVASAFFPSTPYDIGAMLGGDELSLKFDMKGMDHHLRAFTNVETGLKINSALIVDDNDVEVNGESSLCGRFGVSLVRGDKSSPFELPGHSDLGMVQLRYRFPQTSLLGREKTEDRPGDVYPTTCYLRLTTEPNTGVHLTPLVIYPGQVDVAASLFQSDALIDGQTPPSKENENVVWHRAIVGFAKLVEWFRETKVGQSLRSVLDSSIDNRKSPERDLHLLGRYLNSLARQSMAVENSKLRPVLLKVGAIEQGEMETLPLYITNHNPVPITIMIDVGEVEGMSIALGRDASLGRGDGNSLLDYLPRKGGNSVIAEPRIQTGPLKGHPVNGVRQFLLSDEVAGSFLTQFPYRDAVSISDIAVTKQPLLQKLYRIFALGGFHRAARPLRFDLDAWSHCDQTEHPPLYGSFDKKLPNRRMPGPIILSSDSKTVRRLPVCWDRDSEPEDRPSDGSSVILPPGGVARFDINLRAPPSSVLESDITEFVATGLVLSTDHGEVMPILVVFDALKGKLDVSHAPVSHTENPGASVGSPPPKSTSHGVIRVPVGLFVEPSTIKDSALKIPPRHALTLSDLAHTEIIPRNASLAGESGVSLFMKSTFSRDVSLREVSSCNPWFEVVLNEFQSDVEPDPFLGVNIGAVSSIVSCRDAYGGLPNSSGFPSFFRCALNWLAKKAELQPLGCGLLPALEKGSAETDGYQMAEHGGVQRATRAFERALLVSEWSYKGLPKYSDALRIDSNAFKSGRKRSRDGVVASPIVDVIADAWDSWRVASEFGMRVLSTTLRATIEYNSTKEEKSGMIFKRTSEVNQGHLLSVALRNLTVETVLETPKLLDIERVWGSSLHKEANEGSPSVVELPPTLVATVSSLTIPLRNPTAVPVRVRLAVPPPCYGKDDTDNGGISELGVDESIRANFLGKLGSPYVQTGMKAVESPNENARSLWWDGEGAYFLPDSHGDLIRSHHTMSLQGGAGAHVSLANPSLLSNTAFIVGCDSRCGVRDDSPQKDHGSPQVNLRVTSPIGASAAGGVTLIGRKRSNLPQANQVASDGLYFAAGGSLLSEGEGPSPFAVPYAALDEIIIPPFGEAELGPILFRPPGRSPFLGCKASPGTNAHQGCDSHSFESMIFLENSLTGLERVILRGKAQWESVVFLEAPAEEGLDEFGDIELRSGRYTLVFPGTATTTEDSGSFSRTSSHSVVKEVVLHNNGDVPVAFSTIFLSDTAKLQEKRPRYRRDRCSLGEFRLLDCLHDDSMIALELLPGENRSLYIEHQPKCSRKAEFVALNLGYGKDSLMSGHPANKRAGDATETSVEDIYALHSQGSARKRKESFRGSKIELLVGYEMTDDEFASCVSTTKGVGRFFTRDTSAKKNNLDSRKRRSLGQDITGAMYRMTTFLIAILALTASVATIGQRYLSRKDTSKQFQTILEGSRVKPVDLKEVVNQSIGNNWTAAYRCLARADPMSSDLQALGREQIRQLVLSRYRSMGVLPPQCINNAGMFHRESGGVSNNPGRQVASNKEGNPGSNERIRTLSDAIFWEFTVKEDVGTGYLPVELGWRTAAARGIIVPASLDTCPLTLKTNSLLRDRSSHSASSVDDEDGDQSISGDDDESVTFHATSDDLEEESDIESLDEDMKAKVQTEDASDGPTTKPEDAESNKSQATSVNGSNGNQKSTHATSVNGSSGNQKRTGITHGELAEKDTDSLSANDQSNDGNVLVGKQAKFESDRETAKKIIVDERSEHPPPETVVKSHKKTAVEPAQNKARTDTPIVPKERNGRKEKPVKTVTLKPTRRKTKDKGDADADKQRDQSEVGKERNKKTPKSERIKKQKSAESAYAQRGSPRKIPLNVAIRDTEKKAVVVSPASQPGTPIFRPPPGLAPPPGFGESAGNQPVAASPLHSSESLGSQVSFGREYLDKPSIVSRSLTGESYIPVASSSPLDHIQLPSTASPILPYRIIGTTRSAESNRSLLDDSGGALPPVDQKFEMTGFDIMDFLDGILNEGSGSADIDGGDTGGLLAETQLPEQILPFSANPWAVEAEGYQSRAAAYGIAFEEESGRAAEQTEKIDLPLLTPAAILTASKVDEEEETSGSGSLYATLLVE